MNCAPGNNSSTIIRIIFSTPIYRGKYRANKYNYTITVVPQVSTHEPLNITHNFGLYERLIPGIEISYIILYRSCYSGPFKCSTWALTWYTTVCDKWMVPIQLHHKLPHLYRVYRGGMFYGTMGVFCLFMKWRGLHILLTGGGVFHEVQKWFGGLWFVQV